MRLLVHLAWYMQEDGAREKELLGTEIALSDAMRFKGAAPEIINGRLSSEPRAFAFAVLAALMKYRARL